MTETALPALLIVLPILGATAPLVAGLFRQRVGWSIAAVVLAVEAGLAAWLAHAVYVAEVSGGRIVHVLGGETFGRGGDIETADGQTMEGFVVGIELVADAFSGLLVLLVAGVALGVLAIARRQGPRGNPFYSGYLLLTAGLMGVVLTGDLFNLFVFLEITGLSTYALVASGPDADAAVAALKYLFIGTVGASLYLVGVGYLFLSTGALNMVDVSRSLAGQAPWLDGPLYADPLVTASFAFVAVGLLAKAAIFPLHTWQPDAYQTAPDSVTVYISALVSTSAAYALARITWQVYTPEFFAAATSNEWLLNGVLALATLSVLVGSVLAVIQVRVKRLFAYSSVAQFGLVVLGIGIAVHPASSATATRLAVFGVVVHLLAHALLKAGLFAAASALAAGSGARTVRSYAGLAKSHPGIAGGMAVLGVGLVGVPPTVGFLGKWYLAVAAVESGLWPVALVVLASTLLTLLYIARLVEKLYFDTGGESSSAGSGASGGEPPQGGSAGVGDAGDARAAGDADTPTPVTDGGPTPSLGSLLPILVAVVLALALGIAGGTLTEWLAPVADAVVKSLPEVGGRE